ncbi:hypothetical protein [Paraliomyxa miuraensis]|uniref:hypothetical protein n=1 Tax=Paraliomyxa miuraensis TaxID=376150 RepID=UPI002252E5AC|nr:hypothetical protein [Paraliomyxa miuraensis]MCX4244717.1 hypothetical protein [Paraliomyxa miuraensis]
MSATTSATSTGTSGQPPSTGDATITTADGSDDVLDDGPFGWDCGAAPPGDSAVRCIGTPPYCDPTLQDCPEGDRCAPWSETGQPTWDTAWCVPVVRQPAGLGAPCEVTGPEWSGYDTCDVGLFCVPGEVAPTEGMCWALCSAQGDVEPSCEGEAACAWLFGGAVPVCVESCDPVVPDCAMGRCDAGRGQFECLPWPGSASELGEPCEQPGECVAGSSCVDAAMVPGCAGASCCSAFCDLLAPDPELACTAGQSCEPWFPVGAPVGYEHVGVCSGA